LLSKTLVCCYNALLLVFSKYFFRNFSENKTKQQKAVNIRTDQCTSEQQQQQPTLF